MKAMRAMVRLKCCRDRIGLGGFATNRYQCGEKESPSKSVSFREAEYSSCGRSSCTRPLPPKHQSIDGLFTSNTPIVGWPAASSGAGASLVRVQPNMRLKLAAPTSKGTHLFVNDQTLRRSLSAIR